MIISLFSIGSAFLYLFTKNAIENNEPNISIANNTNCIFACYGFGFVNRKVCP